MQPQTPDSRFLLQNLMDNLADAIYFKDLQSRFIMINKACAEIHGWTPSDVVAGKTDFDVYTREFAEKSLADEQRIIETGESFCGIEEKSTKADGSAIWVSTTKMPLRDSAGIVWGTYGMSRDITEHKEAELRAQRYADEIRVIKEEMENDFSMASELQKTFFPRNYPVFPEGASSEEGCVEFLHQFQSCNEVSGDYCSIHRVSDTEAGIFLCDVPGIGVSAALGAALIRGFGQELKSLGLEPGAYLARMNELLLPLLRQEVAVLNACYLVLDVSTGRIRLATAGHELPIHLKQGREAKWLFEDRSLCGPSLAVQAGATYPTIECQVEPGDEIVLYTDGLYMVENVQGASYGEKRLLDSADSLAGEPLADIFHGLKAEACAFSARNSFSDDVCLVGFQLRKLLR